MAARSGDSDLELTLSQRERVSFVIFMIIIVTYIMKDVVINGEREFELSMMDPQQFFICIFDAFLNRKRYGCWSLLAELLLFGSDQCLHHLTRFYVLF